MFATFLAWKETRDRLEQIIDDCHLVSERPSAKTIHNAVEFVFPFFNQGQATLRNIQVYIKLGHSEYFINQKSSELSSLGAKEPHEVHFIFDRNTPVPFSAAALQTIAVVFEINTYYVKPSGQRFRGTRIVYRFEPSTQTFEKTAQQEPEGFPLAPTRWQSLWQTLIASS